jgi:hypothetical protein
MEPVYKPERYCPICGIELKKDHRCKESTLKAIDSAHKRDPDAILERRIPIARRLHQGLQILDQNED